MPTLRRSAKPCFSLISVEKSKTSFAMFSLPLSAPPSRRLRTRSRELLPAPLGPSKTSVSPRFHT
ncbi:hypothetical protein JCM18905_4344 [Vibrio sp. JCM 18905]|nr:hypothetical protein JCM18905_4344 [Vibrio sp. JCM 18905]